MTTYTQARDALVSYISTQITGTYPTLKVFWENTTTIDTTTVGDRFLQVNVDIEDAVLATFDGVSDHVVGTIGFRFFLKEGKGTREALQVFDTLNALFRQRDYSGVRTGTPAPGAKRQADGWMSQDLRVPFEYYS